MATKESGGRGGGGRCRVFASASVCVLSGCSQALLVAPLKAAGLVDDPKCQFHMLFYYTLPAVFVGILLLLSGSGSGNNNNNNDNGAERKWPAGSSVRKAVGIAAWDICSNTLNYTGASMSGPTIFAIIYSSVTIWAAVFSRVLLGRILNKWQSVCVMVVFFGLAITATDSNENNNDNDSNTVFFGTCLILLGASMHGLTYVMSEAVMTVGDKPLTVLQNNFLQALVAAAVFSVWTVFYTVPRFGVSVRDPVEASGTPVWKAAALLVAFGLSNAVHSVTFFYSLCHFPGGATSIGVMKGLQAVLVFVFTNALYCHKLGGPEMCFSTAKLVSLVTVCGGVLGYGYTSKISRVTTTTTTTTSSSTSGGGGGKELSVLIQKEYESYHDLTLRLVEA